MFIFPGKEIKHINSEIDSKGEKKSKLFENPGCTKRNSLGTTKRNRLQETHLSREGGHGVWQGGRGFLKGSHRASVFPSGVL